MQAIAAVILSAISKYDLERLLLVPFHHPLSLPTVPMSDEHVLEYPFEWNVFLLPTMTKGSNARTGNQARSHPISTAVQSAPPGRLHLRTVKSMSVDRRISGREQKGFWPLDGGGIRPSSRIRRWARPTHPASCAATKFVLR